MRMMVVTRRNQLQIFRYADVLLMVAEAYARIGR